jgi:hypothetical protein
MGHEVRDEKCAALEKQRVQPELVTVSGNQEWIPMRGKEIQATSSLIIYTSISHVGVETCLRAQRES